MLEITSFNLSDYGTRIAQIETNSKNTLPNSMERSNSSLQIKKGIWDAENNSLLSFIYRGNSMLRNSFGQQEKGTQRRVKV